VGKWVSDRSSVMKSWKAEGEKKPHAYFFGYFSGAQRCTKPEMGDRVGRTDPHKNCNM